MAGLPCAGCAAVKLALAPRLPRDLPLRLRRRGGLDLLEAKKDEIFVAPAIGIVYTPPTRPPAWGINRAGPSAESHLAGVQPRVSEDCARRGIRVLPGGDYGFPHNPIGRTRATSSSSSACSATRPAEALMAATQWAARSWAWATSSAS